MLTSTLKSTNANVFIRNPQFTIATTPTHFSIKGPIEAAWSDLNKAIAAVKAIAGPDPEQDLGPNAIMIKKLGPREKDGATGFKIKWDDPMTTTPKKKHLIKTPSTPIKAKLLEEEDIDDTISVHSTTGAQDFPGKDHPDIPRWEQREDVIRHYKILRQEIKEDYPEYTSFLFFLRVPAAAWIKSNLPLPPREFDSAQDFINFINQNKLLTRTKDYDALRPNPIPPHPFNYNLSAKDVFGVEPEEFTLGKRSAAFNYSPTRTEIELLALREENKKLKKDLEDEKYGTLLTSHQRDEAEKTLLLQIKELTSAYQDLEKTCADNNNSYFRGLLEEIAEANFEKMQQEDRIKALKSTLDACQNQLYDSWNLERRMRARYENELVQQRVNVNLREAEIDNLNADIRRRLEREGNLHRQFQTERQENAMMQELLEGPDKNYHFAMRSRPRTLRTPLENPEQASVTVLNELTRQTSEYLKTIDGCYHSEEFPLAKRNCALELIREAPTGTTLYFQPHYSPNPYIEVNRITGQLRTVNSNEPHQFPEDFAYWGVGIANRKEVSNLFFRRLFNIRTNGDMELELDDPNERLAHLDVMVRYIDNDYIRELRNEGDLLNQRGENVNHLRRSMRNGLSSREAFSNEFGVITGDERPEPEIQRRAIGAALCHTAWPWASFHQSCLALASTELGQEWYQGNLTPFSQSHLWDWINPLSSLRYLQEPARMTPDRIKTEKLYESADRLVPGEGLRMTLAVSKTEDGWKIEAWKPVPKTQAMRLCCTPQGLEEAKMVTSINLVYLENH